VTRDDLLMPENDEDEDGEYEEDGEEEEAVFDKMGNTVPK
jgi:hypothetical protein